ncbi:hypothetical protein IGI04_040570 [Brassica rapa subsp. trilocularis]|uniref:Replication protein A 70 kDa DNA-binding subunit B/D first OB fold domain-containing protein n=1 Tax=Brassica rapa subsp. trilocularis TaxID=1813537 RepID=A0ABQ7KRP6_BRACM|nr:hypothetical protein IGI04_040570 [Brassica rapa subsp. trilocularis]
MATFSYFSGLKPNQCNQEIKTKIVRAWKQHSPVVGESIELGDIIHATIKKDFVRRYDRIMKEGYSMIIVNFAVMPSVGAYRITHHAYKIAFLDSTRICICLNLPRQLNGFQPVPFCDVLDGNFYSDYLVDVIGQVVGFSNVDIISVHGKDTHKLSLQLRNEVDHRLTINVWGKQAEVFSDALRLGSSCPLICVVRFGKITERTVSNVYNISDIALHPDMDDVEAFLKLLPRKQVTVEHMDSKPICLVSDISEKKDFFAETPWKTIAELLDTTHVQMCFVVCTIAALDTEKGWYYLSCNVCGVEVHNVSNDWSSRGAAHCNRLKNYYCVKCKTHIQKPDARYALNLVVLDSTGDTNFLLFEIALIGGNIDEVYELIYYYVFFNLLEVFYYKYFLHKQHTSPTLHIQGRALPAVLTERVGATMQLFKVLKLITSTDCINELAINHYPMLLMFLLTTAYLKHKSPSNSRAVVVRTGIYI